MTDGFATVLALATAELPLSRETMRFRLDQIAGLARKGLG